MNHTKKEIIRDYIWIILGTTIVAAAINMFFEKQQLVTGGVTGLAIVIKHVTESIFGGGIPLWLTNISLNVPLFIIGVKVHGKGFGTKTLFATFYLSFALYYTKFLPIPTTDLLLSSIFGGVVGGVGLGMVFSTFATTGGTDLLASILQVYSRHISVARILLLIDSLIILSGLFVFGIERAMYAIIVVYITVKVIDNILEGITFSKAAFIISNCAEQIADEIMLRLDRGVTGLKGRGMYTKFDKEVLFCVVSQKQIVQVKEIVKEIDSSAFVIVADVREVFGEGFIPHIPKK